MSRRRKGRRRSRPSAQRRALAMAAFVIGAPLIGWSAYGWVSGGGDDTPAISTAGDTSPLGDAGTSTASGDVEQDAAVADAMAACTTYLDAGAAVVKEATTGVGNWSGHIGARTGWLAGRISDEQKAATYKETKLAGPDDQRRFHAALEEYESLADCSELDELVDAGVAGDLANAIDACLDRRDGTDAAVLAGSAAMADWQEHLDAMAAHADGEMTDTEGNVAWEQAATAAPTNINAFEEASDKWENASECSVADS